MMIRVLRALLVSGVLTSLAGCGGDDSVRPNTPSPTPTSALASPQRTLAVELATTATGDAGMIFTIDGPNIISIAPAPGFDLQQLRAESGGRTSIDVLIVGPLGDGVVAWLTTKGTNSGKPYTARVTQVAAGAAGGFVQREDLGAYRLTVR